MLLARGMGMVADVEVFPEKSGAQGRNGQPPIPIFSLLTPDFSLESVFRLQT